MFAQRLADSNVNVARSSEEIARHLRECQKNGSEPEYGVLCAAIMILGVVNRCDGIFYPPLRHWCARALKLFRRAANGTKVDIDCAEAASWFDLLNILSSS